MNPNSSRLYLPPHELRQIAGKLERQQKTERAKPAHIEMTEKGVVEFFWKGAR